MSGEIADDNGTAPNTCERCGATFYYPPASHRCAGEWEAICAEAGAPALTDPYAGMTWVEECQAKQREKR